MCRCKRILYLQKMKWLRVPAQADGVQVQNLRELARIGMARDIDIDPRGLYHKCVIIVKR